jgi:hypothetical protein
MSSAGACSRAEGVAEGQRMAKAEVTRTPPPAGRTLAPGGNPQVGGGRGPMPSGPMMIVLKEAFNLAVEIGGGGGVGAVGALTALVTREWMMRTNQRMSTRTVVQ